MCSISAQGSTYNTKMISNKQQSAVPLDPSRLTLGTSANYFPRLTS